MLIYRDRDRDRDVNVDINLDVDIDIERGREGEKQEGKKMLPKHGLSSSKPSPRI